MVTAHTSSCRQLLHCVSLQVCMLVRHLHLLLGGGDGDGDVDGGGDGDGDGLQKMLGLISVV